MTGGDACICGRTRKTAYRSVARVTIPGRLMALNEYTASQRGNLYVGAKAKKQAQYDVQMVFRAARLHRQKFRCPVFIRLTWVEKNRARDMDNIAFAKKIIFDALVAERVIPGDGWRHLVGFSDRFAVDKHNPRILVEILEVEDAGQEIAIVK